MLGLAAGRLVIVSLPRGQKARGVIVEVFEKSYLVQIDGGTRQRFSATKIKPESGRKPTAKLEPMPAQRMPRGEQWADQQLREMLSPVPKSELPEECPAWLAFVRKQPCCNCGSGQNVEPHHEGKKGVSQKVRDTLAVPLCLTCHRVYTDKNRLPLLPFPESGVFGEDDVCTRETSLQILQQGQEQLLLAVLHALHLSERVEILSRGIARVPKPGALSRVLAQCEESA